MSLYVTSNLYWFSYDSLHMQCLCCVQDNKQKKCLLKNAKNDDQNNNKILTFSSILQLLLKKIFHQHDYYFCQNNWQHYLSLMHIYDIWNKFLSCCKSAHKWNRLTTSYKFFKPNPHLKQAMSDTFSLCFKLFRQMF